MSTLAAPVDVLALMAGSQTGILSACQSEAPGTPGGAEPMYPWLNGPAGQFCEMKNAAGWPADGYVFNTRPNDPYIYQTFTEIDTPANYNQPNSYKIFASSSTPSGGIIWAPRYYTPGDPEVLIETADSTYLTYLNGVAQPKANLGGPTATGFSGPWNDVNFGGNIGQAPYYLQRYLYNPGFASQEQNCYVPGFGRVRWQLFGMVGGVYVLNQTALYNTLLAGPCPKLAWQPVA